MDYCWAEIDTAETFLDGHGFNLERPIYDYFIANRMSSDNAGLYDIVGQTCNAEILVHRLPAPARARQRGNGAHSQRGPETSAETDSEADRCV